MKSANPNSLEGLIDLIYEAAVLPDAWTAALSRISVLSDTIGSVLIARSSAGLKMAGSSPAFLQDATEYFIAFSAQNERLKRLIAHEHCGFVADSDVFSKEELEMHPMFRDFLIPRGYGQGLATMIPMPSGDEIILHCEGKFLGKPTAPALIARMDAIRPHIARAALVASQIAFEAARTAVETLTRLGIAAASIGFSGEILLTNEAFDREDGIWTTRLRNQIVLKDVAAQSLLDDALRYTRHATTVRSLPITKEGGPAILHVIPVCRDARDLFSRTSAIIVLTKVVKRTGPTATLLQALFDLTPSEAAVTQKLSIGMSAREIANASGKSIETIRNQIKRVLNKVGCARQSELLSTLTTLAMVSDVSPQIMNL